MPEEYQQVFVVVTGRFVDRPNIYAARGLRKANSWHLERGSTVNMENAYGGYLPSRLIDSDKHYAVFSDLAEARVDYLAKWQAFIDRKEIEIASIQRLVAAEREALVQTLRVFDVGVT